MIFEMDDKPGWVGVLRAGYLRRERLTRDGCRILVGLDLPGDLIGQLPGYVSKYTLEAATDCEICLFQPGIAKRMMREDARFRRGLVTATSDQLSRQLLMAWMRGALSSRERIFAFLLWAAQTMPTERLPDGSVIVSIPIDRQDWADLCNTTVESVSRRMTELSTAGIVTSAADRRYRIADLGQLTEMAGLTDGDLAIARATRPEPLTVVKPRAGQIPPTGTNRPQDRPAVARTI